MESATLFSSSPSSSVASTVGAPKKWPWPSSSPHTQAKPISVSGRFVTGSSSLHRHSHSHFVVGKYVETAPTTVRQRRRRGTLVLASSSAAAVPSSNPDSSSSSPSPPLSDIVWPASGAFVAMAAMSALDKLIEPMGLTFTIAPFGAVCAVLFSAPNTPAAKKYNMFVAHIGCAAMGVAALFLFGPGWLARGTSLAASLVFMQLTGSLHPPGVKSEIFITKAWVSLIKASKAAKELGVLTAAGLPLLFIDVPKFQQLQWWYIIFPSAVGCILLCLLQEVVLFLRKSCRF